MARRVLAGVLIAAVLGAAGSALADRLPILRSARAVRHHLVLRIAVTDARPIELLVARRRAVDADGALLSRNVRVREAIVLPASATGVVRWRSTRTFHTGRYFVQVEAVETGGVTDCPPKQRDCGAVWSNVRRVVVGNAH